MSFERLKQGLWRLALCAAPLALLVPSAVSGAPGVETDAAYVINLESTRSAQKLPSIAILKGLPGDSVYTTQATVDGQDWHRLRVGFFVTEADAELALAMVREQYPQAWVTLAAAEERAAALEQQPHTIAITAPGPAKLTLTQEKLASLMLQARSAMGSGDYQRAVQLYTKVLRAADNQHTRQAQEYLGLSRERNNQLAHAKAEYRTYLERYPDDDGAERVAQRLAGLASAREAPRQKLRAASTVDGDSPWRMHGGLSQYYRQYVNELGNGETRTAQSAVNSYFHGIARRSGERFEIEARLSGGNLYDMLPDDEGPGNRNRVSYLYVEVADNELGWSSKIGRQRRNRSGLLGRFDGGHFQYQLNPGIRLNLVAGFPVNSYSDGLDTVRSFQGMSADFGTTPGGWDFSAFYNRQQIDNLQDRSAIGGELRYFRDGKALVGALDFDLLYSTLNSVFLQGSWQLQNSRFAINALIDHRNSPVLTTRNALIGQPVRTIEELSLLYTDEEIRKLAQDRTSAATTFSAGLSRALFDRFRISVDATLTDIGETVESGGVPAIPGTDRQMYVSSTLTGSSLLKEGDIAIASLRYSDTATTQISMLSLDMRYPFTRSLRINPRIRAWSRNITADDSREITVAPSLRMFYRLRRHLVLELEAGGQWSSRGLATGDIDYSTYFLNVGYRADF